MKMKKKILAVISSQDRKSLEESIDIRTYKELTFSFTNSIPDILSVLKRERVDAILLDMDLIQDGLADVLKKINRLNQDVPVLFLSDETDIQKLAQVITAGAQDVLPKSGLQNLTVFRSILFAIERKKAEIAQRVDNTRFQKMLDNFQDGIQIIGFDWKYLYLNNVIEKNTGICKDDLLGKVFFDIWQGMEDSEIVRGIKKSMEERLQVNLETVFPYPDGQAGWYDLRIQPVAQGVLIFSQDITERKLQEETIKISQDRYRVLIENMSQGVIFYDQDGKILEMNPAIEKITGLSEEELTGIKPADRKWNVIHEDGSEFLNNEFPSVQALQSAKPVENVVMGVMYEGKVDYTWIRINAYPRFHNQENRPFQVYATFEDITFHKLAEMEFDKRLALKERLEKIAASMPGLICSFRQKPDGTASMPYASPAIRQVYGLEHSDVKEDITPIFTRINSEDLAHVQETILSSRENMTEWYAEYRFQHTEKGEVWLEGRSKPVREADGSVIWHGVISDITLRKQLELQLRDKENHLKTILSSTSDGFWLVSCEGRFLDVNQAYCRMSGYTREELLQMSIFDIEAVESAKETQKHIRSVFERGSHLFETRHRRKDGHVFDVEMNITALINNDDILACFSRDITERKRAEEEIRQNSEDQALINEINEAVNQRKNMAYIVRVLHQEAQKSFGISVATFFLLDESEENLILHGYTLLPEALKMIENFVGGKLPDFRLPVMKDTLCWKYMHHPEGFLIDDVDEIERWMGEFIESDQFSARVRSRMKKNMLHIRKLIGIASVIIVPLIYQQKNIGLLVVSHRERFSESDFLRLRKISRPLTAAILRQQNEEALSISNERFSQLAGNILEVFWMFDQIERRMIYVSPAYEMVWGKPVEEPLSNIKTVIDSLVPEDRHILLNSIKLQAQGKKTEFEYRIKRADGQERWIWDRSFPILDENGKLLRTAGLATDITENKKAEMVQKERESFLQSIVDSSPGYFVAHDLQGNFLFSNRSWPGQTEEQLKMSNIRDIVHPDDVNHALEVFRKVIETKKFRRTEQLALTYDGEYHWYEVVYSPVILDGEVIRVTSFSYDIHERKQARIILQASEEKYRLLSKELEERVRQRTAELQDLYDHAPAGYHSLDSEGKIIRINQTELDWLGYSAEEVVGKLPFLDMLTPESSHIFKQNYPLFMKKGWISNQEFDFVRKDGSIFPTVLNATAIYDENGKYVMSRTTVTDNSKHKLAEVTLRQSRDNLKLANEALEKAAKLKDEFLASMSHELRTPLTGILGLSEVLLLHTYGALNEKQENALKNIEDSGRHLLELINDILDLSKIEAGKLELHFDWCSVNDVCEASLQIVRGMVGKKAQTLNFTTNLAAPIIYADARRLKQMLVNLLSNAVKFTPEGGSVGLEVLGSDEEKIIHFSVWDTGIGIEEEKIPLLFKPFTQLDSGLARQHSGTGLGLSLVYRMAEMHGGSLQVESTAGKGSRFSINLPWEQQKSQPQPQPHLGPEGLQSSLTVEDNELDAEHITRYLSNLGINNIVSPNGMEAVELASEIKPDIIMLDLLLPDKSGFDVLKDLKVNPITASIPVLVTSVMDRQNQAIALGAAGYLIKPFTFTDMHDELSRIVSEADKPELVMLITPQHEIPVVMIVDDNEITRQTLSDFLQAQNLRAVTASSGQELLNMVSEVQPDIILMDIQMPGMDGLEVTRRLRSYSNPMISQVPILAITALAMSGDRERCLKAGANDYISKPFQMMKLLETINSFVRHSESAELYRGN